MKFRLYREYGALNSKPVFDAFEQSLESFGHTIVSHDASDVDVIWSVLFHGRMAQNKHIWDQARKRNKPVIVLEVGGIRRGTTWKVGLNGINRDAFFGPGGNDSRRCNLLDLRLKPWTTSGTSILLCGQHDRSLQWDLLPNMTQWVKETIEHIRHYTDRPIIFRPHPRCHVPQIEQFYKDVTRQTPRQTPGTYDDYDMLFNDIYCTVSWTSNPGIHSVINGVPSYTSPSSLAYDVSIKSLANLENPTLHDRQQWLNDYAYTEWTVEEIAQGMPLQRLESKLNG
mgnify:CR=1 FL=1